MASTVAMFSALSGLNASSRTIDVVGNNIANINTTAFKSGRIQLSESFYRTLRSASSPTDTTGGSNPSQIGLGVSVAGVTRSLQQGSLTVTGDSGDLAIEGDGYFVVSSGGSQYYTRAGNFRLDALNRLVSPGGDILQGYLADADFNVPDSGALASLDVPLGGRTITQATTTARLNGRLNAAGDVALSGSSTTIGGTATAGLRVVVGAAPPPGAGEQIVSASLLTDIEDPATAVGSGTRLFAVGQIIQLQGAQRGTATLPSAQYTITAASTVTDLMNFISQSLAIETGGTNPDGGVPGAMLDALTGYVHVTGNTGALNNLTIASSSLRLLNSAGTFLRSPFVSQSISEASGESVE